VPIIKSAGVLHLVSELKVDSAHGVTGVASLILLADIGDQRLRALHFDFERGDQCIFGVNNDVSRFALNFKADRKLHLCLPLSMFKNIVQFGCEVELLGPVRFSICEDMPSVDELRNQSFHIGHVVVWPKLDWKPLSLNRESQGLDQEVGVAPSNVRLV
jgi:hypothetical protein